MKTKTPEIEYIADAEVDAQMDAALRLLLSSSFTEERDAFFKERRYYKEYPHHRWFIRDEQQALIAHVAVHEKHVLRENETFRFGGISEVCVHPNTRGCGYVKKLLNEVHTWLRSRNFPYAILFGKTEYYGSSGYAPVSNLYLETEIDENIVQHYPENCLVASLGHQPWPKENVFLPGPTF